MLFLWIYSSCHFYFQQFLLCPIVRSGIECKGETQNLQASQKIFVASTTSGTYSENIILFVLWLFDTRREFLVQEYIPEFKIINREDLLDFQRRE